jgi:hypothetical protein
VKGERIGLTVLDDVCWTLARFDDARDLSVGQLAPSQQERVVGDLLGDDVVEAVLDLIGRSPAVHPIEKSQADQLVEQRHEWVGSDQAREQIDAELPADDGGHPQHLPQRRRQCVDAPEDDRLHVVGNGEIIDLVDQDHLIADRTNPILTPQGGTDLLDEEGIAVRALEYHRRQSTWDGVDSEAARNHRDRRICGEWPEVDDLGIDAGGECGLPRTLGHDDEERARRDRSLQTDESCP